MKSAADFRRVARGRAVVVVVEAFGAAAFEEATPWNQRNVKSSVRSSEAQRTFIIDLSSSLCLSIQSLYGYIKGSVRWFYSHSSVQENVHVKSEQRLRKL